MKRILKFASILSKVNMFIWGTLTAFVILGSLVSGIQFLIIAFFLSSIPLYEYASLKFHKSLRDPLLPLSRQTINGVRFMGFVVLFLGISSIANGVAALRNSKELLQLEQSMLPSNVAGNLTVNMIRAMGSIVLILGILLTINVMLNTRLLRWYLMSQQDDEPGKQ